MLELMKLLLGISDSSLDTILNFYISKSINSIKNYINIDWIVDYETTYQNQIVELAIYFYRNKDNIGVIQLSQGSRSQTNAQVSIPESIKSTLPLPSLKVMG